MSARKSNYTVSTKRGGTYVVSTEPTDLAVYTSIFFTEYERRFFVDFLDIKSIEFSAAANCQIFCRTLIHDLTKQANHAFSTDSGASMVARGSQSVMCFHSFGKITTSWAWIKFAVTLFRQGFNVILVDLPGFGKSSVGRDIRCDVNTWRSWNVTMISMLMAKLQIPKINVMASHESASIFTDILLQNPQLLGGNHVLYNPVFSIDSEEQDATLTGNLIRSFLTGGMRRRVFAAFDRNRQSTVTSSDTADTSRTTNSRLLLAERIMRRVSKAVGFNQVIVSAISSIDLAEICLYDPTSQPGVRPIHALYPCKAFRIYVCQFMAGESMVEFQPSIAIPESSMMRIRMDGSTPRVSSRAASSRLPLSPRSSREPRAVGSTSINNFSYGVRIRKMEEDLVVDVAKMDSEKTFVATYGEEEFRRQQNLMDVFANNTQEDSGKSNTISLMRSNLGPNSLPGATERVLLGVSQYQKSVEDSIRNQIDSP